MTDYLPHRFKALLRPIVSIFITTELPDADNNICMALCFALPIQIIPAPTPGRFRSTRSRTVRPIAELNLA
ncbi:MAG: hypothetical protein IPI30_09445 [Saprospiraceae bacterium]|nr:hypothetical protein [Candidatus Vicinibacter affinis]